MLYFPLPHGLFDIKPITPSGPPVKSYMSLSCMDHYPCTFALSLLKIKSFRMYSFLLFSSNSHMCGKCGICGNYFTNSVTNTIILTAIAYVLIDSGLYDEAIRHFSAMLQVIFHYFKTELLHFNIYNGVCHI